MTVRAILDTKGHQIQSVEPEAKLSAATKILAERKIGAVMVMSKGSIEGILSERDIVRVLGDRGAAVLDEPGQCGHDAQGRQLQAVRYGQWHHGNDDAG